jgi:8-oxo-dGTP pyrophosphatase MutT (NUDIX family)
MGACKALPARSTTRAMAQRFCSTIRAAQVSFSCVSFACPLFLRRRHESLIEVCAGKPEGEDAESRISKEAGEETGFTVRNPRRDVEAYMNPGSFAEKLTFFAAGAAGSYRRLMVRFRGSVVAVWERYVWMPTKSALPGARRADVTGFGMPEHQGDGSALPRLVQSGNLSLEIW